MSAFSKNIVFQSFIWDYEKYKDPLTHHQEIWAVGKFAEETSEKTSTSNTCLVRIKDYPYKVDLEIKNKNYQPLMSNFQDWMFRNAKAQRKYFPEEAEVMSGIKHYQKRYEHYKETMSHTEPLEITVDENRRTIYHFKPIKFENGKYVEDTICQMTLCFANKDIAKMFVVGHLKMSFSNRNGKYTTFKLYEDEFELRLLNFGVTPIVRLLNEINCKRCQWIKISNPEIVKPASRLCNNEFISNYRTYEGVEKSERIYTHEFYVSWKDLSPYQGSNYISVPRLLSFDIECYSDNHKAIPNPWSLKHKITGISAVFQIGNDRSSRTRKAFVIPRCRTDKPTEGDGQTNAIVVCNSEYDMLNQFFEFVRATDPDILIGYNIFGFDIPYMDTRLVRSMKSWGDMSRIKNEPTTLGMANWASSAYGKNVLCWLEATGRFCVDMMVVIQRDYKFNDYKLETVSQALLNKGKNDVSAIEMFEIYERCVQNIPGCDDEMLRVMEYCLQDSVLPTELFEKINGWAFLIESANVMNVNPIELFTRGQQLRLMNQYYDKCAGMGYSIDRRKANVIEAEGALVVDPVKGVHNDIMVFDFASLYPSIIIAYNISHDTLVLDERIPDEHCHVFKWKDSDDVSKAKELGAEVETIKETLHDLIGDALQDDDGEKDPDVTHFISKTEDGYWKFRFIKPEFGHKGIACVTLEDLLAERKRVRKEQGNTKDSVQWSILEERQKAVKVSCNSIYGMLLAQSTGKLALAEGGVCTTAKGRELNLLMQTIIKEEFLGKTIYGDTDSVMIYSALILKICEHTQEIISSGKDFPTSDWKQDYELIKAMINESNPEIKDSFIQKFAEPFLRMTSLAHTMKSVLPSLGFQCHMTTTHEPPMEEHFSSIDEMKAREAIISKTKHKDDKSEEFYHIRWNSKQFSAKSVKDVLAKVVIVWNEEHKIAEHIDEEVLSHMLVWEHCGVASDILLCTMMGNLISESISSRLPKPIKLEFENIFHTALYMMKKRYACIKIDAKTKKPIMNKKKIYSKGIMLARRDQCAWAKETFENTLWDDLLRKDIRVLAVEVAEMMLAPLRWQYPLQSFAVTQKLGYDYASDTYPLKLFAEHLEDIGKPARANDRVQYVVTKAPHMSSPDKLDVKLGQKFRLIETLRDEMTKNTNSIDHMYYVDRLKNDMDQILSIGYMDQIAKYSEERRTKRMISIKNRIDSLQEQITELQDENTFLGQQTDKNTKKERSEKIRKNKGELTNLKKSLEESTKTLAKLEAGDNKSEVPKKLKGIYKGIIKLHLDEEIFKHQLKLIQHYSDSVVAEVKALNNPAEERADAFAKLWLVENDSPKLVVSQVVNLEPKPDNQKKVTDFFAPKE